jgi:hypothetical protein
MKMILKNSNYFALALVLCVVIISGCSCSTSKPQPDPLAGFHVSSLGNLDSNKAITDDYKSYIQTLSSDEQKFIGYIEYFEDETKQHAVKITIGLNGTVWEHVLIYDKDDKRIKTIKYSKGGYQS